MRTFLGSVSLKILTLSMLVTSVAFADQGEDPPPPPKNECPLFDQSKHHENVLETRESYQVRHNIHAHRFQFHAFYERYAVKNDKGEVIDCEYPIYQWKKIEDTHECYQMGACVNLFDCRGCYVGTVHMNTVIRIDNENFAVQKIGVGSMKALMVKSLDPNFLETLSVGLESDHIYGAISLDKPTNPYQSTEALFNDPEEYRGERVIEGQIFTGNGETVDGDGKSAWARLWRENPSVEKEWKESAHPLSTNVSLSFVKALPKMDKNKAGKKTTLKSSDK